MHAAGGFVESDAVLAALLEVEHAQREARGDALGDNEVALEHVEVVEHHLVARGDDLLGAGEVRRGSVDADETEVAPGIVDANDEPAVAMLDVDLDVGAAREHGSQLRSAAAVERGVGVDHAHFRRVHALGRNDDVALVTRFRHADAEQLVGPLRRA